MEKKLILASGSPRRRELLAQMGIDFIVCAADVDEHLSGSPEQVVTALAERKARAAYALHPGETVLGADTLVSCAGRTLGKPQNAEEAYEMLRLLSDNTNIVYTGVCLIDGRTGEADVRCDTAWVHFVPLDDASIWRYIATGEPLDKAGAYGVQGMAGMFVSSIEGSPSNVIGLPMHLVREMLRKIGWVL